MCQLLQTSSRPREVGGSFASRRGQSNHKTLSISDPSHHVTEAIGTLYGSDDNDSDTDQRPEAHRPLSFLSSPYGGEQLADHQPDGGNAEDGRRPLVRSASDNTPGALTTNMSPTSSRKYDGRPNMQRNASYENRPQSPASPMSPSSSSLSPMSPTMSLRDVRDAEQSIPMTNIDNPNAIAQELSNLQILRRMSMDVGNSNDPDLMPFSGMMPIPSMSPTGDDDEADPSRLLWVPANVHPELAPEQFKNFLERRVNSMKRRSGESMLSVDGLERNDSMSSLRRKKSMLSRQIDNSGGRGAVGYVDGATRLGRQKSLHHSTPELSLDELVNDPAKAVQKLAQEAHIGSDGSGPSDKPILIMGPGMGLRRSKHTQYRKGGSLRGNVPFSKRIANSRSGEQDGEESVPAMPQMPNAPPGYGLTRVQSEPPTTGNFSLPTKSIKRQQKFEREVPLTSPTETHAQEESFGSGSASNPVSPERLHHRDTSGTSVTPQIVETPPNDQPEQTPSPFPERSSSQKAREQMLAQTPQPQQQQRPRVEEQHSARPNGKNVPLGRAGQQPPNLENVAPGPTQTMNDIVGHPSAIPGNSGTRTDSLTFIPTLPEQEKKKSRDNDGESSRPSSGWKWFKSEKEKKKEKDKDKDKSKSVDKSHETARLDVIQGTIDNVVSKGRESLLLDRDSIDSKLSEERKKESSRKSADGKKEKDGFFESFFSKKKKSDKESFSKKSQRTLTPEPPPKVMKPDVDYHWTRFPLLEERAIYRMAHIKLANPKRNLSSQVLLSNFMYSYLAKIQAMHPQMQVPVSPQQKRLEEEKRRKEQEQAYLEQQQQLQQQQAQGSIGQYNFEYHRVCTFP